MPVRRPRIRLTVDGAPVEGLLRLDLVSSPEALRAAVTCSPRAPVYGAGAEVEVQVDGTLMLRGPVHTVEPIRRRMRRYLAEPAASQALRGFVADRIGPLSWRNEQAETMAREVLSGLPHDLAELPAVGLRWSCPEASRRWVLDSFLAAVSAAAGVEVRHLVSADGMVRLGPLESLREPSSVYLRTGETVLSRRGDRYLTIASAARWNTTVDVDGAELVCVYSRLDVRAGRYRSRLVLKEAPA